MRENSVCTASALTLAITVAQGMTGCSDRISPDTQSESARHAPIQARALLSSPGPDSKQSLTPTPIGGNLLMDVVGPRDARVLAIIKDGKWLDPEPQQVKAIAAEQPQYLVFPSEALGTVAGYQGTLHGSLRVDCSGFFTQLSDDAPGLGYAVTEPVHYEALKRVSLNPAQQGTIATLVKSVTKRAIKPNIIGAYSVDLDGNGQPEIVVLATHADLATDFAKYKSEYYSLLVVLPDNPGGHLSYVGYVQAKQQVNSFQVLELDSVVAINGAGPPTLLVRARHEEGFQTQVYEYHDGLKEVYRSTDGENDCQETAR